MICLLQLLLIWEKAANPPRTPLSPPRCDHCRVFGHFGKYCSYAPKQQTVSKRTAVVHPAHPSAKDTEWKMIQRSKPVAQDSKQNVSSSQEQVVNASSKVIPADMPKRDINKQPSPAVSNQNSANKVEVLAQKEDGEISDDKENEIVQPLPVLKSQTKDKGPQTADTQDMLPTYQTGSENSQKKEEEEW